MKTYNSYQIKQIKKAVEYGDVNTACKELNVSRTTAYNALNGTALTKAERKVLMHMELIIQQRKDRLAAASRYDEILSNAILSA